MNEELRKVVAGAGSYVALFVMIWFAMRDAPAWLVLFAGIGNGVLFTYVMGIFIPFVINVYRVTVLLTDVFVGRTPKEVNAEMMEAYTAYIYEQAKLSDLQKGVS